MTAVGATFKPFKKVKSILVSQPKPEHDKSPYYTIAKDYDIKVDFRPFIHVEDIDPKEFRKSKIYLQDYSSIIMTSRNAIEHYFKVAEETRYKVPETTKYFCLSEAIALYLQKYIQYRKRKIFFADGKYPKLIELLAKHKEKGAGKFLIPCSDVSTNDLSPFLIENEIPYEEAVMYRTVASDLSDLREIKYDMIVFFSPSGVESLYKNFPDFVQGETRLAAWGKNTMQAILDHNLRLDVKAPDENAPSMTSAIINYLKQSNKK